MALQEQIVEQLTNHPDTIHNIFVLPITAIGVGLWARHDIRGVHEDKTDTELNFDGANGPIFNKVITEAETGKPFTEKAYNTWYRVGHQVMGVVGLGILTASLLSQPTIEASTTVDHGSIEAVLDTSSSMLNTHDMSNNQSRFDAGEQALISLPNSVNLGVVQFGYNANNTVTLGPKNNKQLESLANNASEVDPNGGNVSDAIDLALSDLPTRHNNPALRSGELLIISDGTVDQSSGTDGSNTGNTIQYEAAKAKSEGVDVKVIVPGSDSKSAQYYYLGTGPYKDGVTPNSYSAFGGKNIITTSSSESVASAVGGDVKALAATTEKQVTWYPPYVVGLGLIGASAVISSRRKRSKKS